MVHPMHRIAIIFVTLVLVLFIQACNKNVVPVAFEGETPYGVISQIDNYPLYRVDYTADYKFDEYLETGAIPFYSAISSKSDNFSCTCFAAFGEDTRLLGRNYDWSTRTTYFLVFTNPPAAFSSISTVDMYFFNYDQNKSPDDESNLAVIRTLPYYPFDGMNEKGVAIGMNALDRSESPYNSSKVTIGELQLIRLVLDYAASTSEAISLIQQYNIRMENPPIHYLIADASGHSVVLEFVNGNMVVMDNTKPWQVTTNFIITGLDHYNNAPCWRYKSTCTTLDSQEGVITVPDAFNLLQTVSVTGTRWSTVFDLNTAQLQIAMGRNFDTLYHFSIR
jgi:hypothetical protein